VPPAAKSKKPAPSADRTTYDFLDLASAGETDRHAIETLGSALAGSGRPLVEWRPRYPGLMD
jgi:hypothetical protein